MRMAIALLQSEIRNLESAISFHQERMLIHSRDSMQTASNIRECQQSIADMQKAIGFLDVNRAVEPQQGLGIYQGTVETAAKLDVTQAGQSVVGQNQQRHI